MKLRIAVLSALLIAMSGAAILGHSVNQNPKPPCPPTGCTGNGGK